ncbi:DUF7853 family protein [Haloarchaeobius amylolyticus]|uniref:DUF7853 family protein n=1 Tax=Haloarchaeobius amylolyticus TaxID=1198296 RepID=UPI002270AC33|nr:hypothetical protein [Haloarchaeobius amylolyticus]
MAATHHPGPECEFGLGRAEAWVVHHVMVEQLTREDHDGEEPWWALDIVRKLENGTTTFTTYEAWRLREALLAHAERAETPDTDVAMAMAIVHRIEETFGSPPMLES